MRIGKFGGIGVYIHWSFWLLIAFYLIAATASAGLAAGLYAVAFVGSVFACVVAHEFGHAFAAAAFGIRTSDITLLPIGGVARLERMPEKPIQEFIIAVAGPAVNVVIAMFLFFLLLLGMAIPASAPQLGSELGFLEQLLAANVILVLFNMLPAFPMDGGRVLRSFIAMWTQDHLRATEIAARVGRWMALAFLLFGVLYGHFGLMLVALFVFLAGSAELMGARMRAVSRGGYGSGPFSRGGAGAFPGNQSGFDGSPRGYATWHGVWPENGGGWASHQRDYSEHDNSAHADWQPRTEARPSHAGNIVDAVHVRQVDK